MRAEVVARLTMTIGKHPLDFATNGSASEQVADHAARQDVLQAVFERTRLRAERFELMQMFPEHKGAFDLVVAKLPAVDALLMFGNPPPPNSGSHPDAENRTLAVAQGSLAFEFDVFPGGCEAVESTGPRVPGERFGRRDGEFGNEREFTRMHGRFNLGGPCSTAGRGVYLNPLRLAEGEPTGLFRSLFERAP